LSEFALIDAIRGRGGCTRADVELGIGDDAAVVDVPAGQRLVACTDTLVAGVHFLPATVPADVGWKALAVNLSDLAAMGAEPAWALVALALPAADAGFVTGFAEGFAALARQHDVALVGGDMTQGKLTVTVTALGLAPTGQILTRAGAREGEAVFVTGTLGDAAGALQMLRDLGPGTRNPGGQVTELLARLNRPEPRIAAGLALRTMASACIDVSDGLVADLGHVCAAGGVGAEVDAAALPLSTALRATFEDAVCRGFALGGGDDYELCFTAPASKATAIVARLEAAGCRTTRVGRIVADRGVRALDVNGEIVATAQAGWEHFRA
jgi:thiamine-monophosphate kinase